MPSSAEVGGRNLHFGTGRHGNGSRVCLARRIMVITWLDIGMISMGIRHGFQSDR